MSDGNVGIFLLMEARWQI